VTAFTFSGIVLRIYLGLEGPVLTRPFQVQNYVTNDVTTSNH